MVDNIQYPKPSIDTSVNASNKREIYLLQKYLELQKIRPYNTTQVTVLNELMYFQVN